MLSMILILPYYRVWEQICYKYMIGVVATMLFAQDTKGNTVHNSLHILFP